ncbi:MAG: zinc ribbon domain-containing protein [Candidatus Thorarchaeota archaeon]|nr:MAG: zinc ribbon domain-containing protein [Candidatus Thorarchaeota archaeon]
MSLAGIEQGGFVFIFPFFVYGGSNELVGIILLGFLAVVLFMFALSYRSLTDLRMVQETLRRCRECGEILPNRARYCLGCGNPVAEDNFGKWRND